MSFRRGLIYVSPVYTVLFILMNELLHKKRYLKSWLNVIVFLNLYILIYMYLTMDRVVFIFDWILLDGEASNQIRRIFVLLRIYNCLSRVNGYNRIILRMPMTVNMK